MINQADLWWKDFVGTNGIQYFYHYGFIFLWSLLLRNPRAILKILDYHHLGGGGGWPRPFGLQFQEKVWKLPTCIYKELGCQEYMQNNSLKNRIKQNKMDKIKRRRAIVFAIGGGLSDLIYQPCPEWKVRGHSTLKSSGFDANKKCCG